MSDSEKFDENFFQLAKQKKQEIQQLAAGSGDPIVKFDPDKPILMSRADIRGFVAEFAAPLEAKAFELGRRAGLAEAKGNPGNFEREETAIMEKVARLVGHGTRTAATRDLSPVGLAKRATELQDAALAEGKKLSAADAVRQAYAEAGVSREAKL